MRVGAGLCKQVGLCPIQGSQGPHSSHTMAHTAGRRAVLVAHTELGLGMWICCSGCQWGPWGGWDMGRAATLLVLGTLASCWPHSVPEGVGEAVSPGVADGHRQQGNGLSKTPN